MNKGLPEWLKITLSTDKNYGGHVVPDFKIKFITKIRTSQEKLDPNWIAGFMEADGCFFVKIQKNKNTENFQIKLGCKITQHNRDSPPPDLLKV